MVPEQRVKTCSYKVCHMVQEQRVKQVPYTVCKPVCYTKTINCMKLVPKQVCLHGDAVRAGGGVQAGSGAGMLPDAGMLRSPAGMRPGRLLQLASSVWRHEPSDDRRKAWSEPVRRPNPSNRFGRRHFLATNPYSARRLDLRESGRP